MPKEENKKLKKALNTQCQQIHSLELSNDEFTDEIEPNSNDSNEETETSRSKKPIIKSKRMGKKPAIASKNTTSIDQFLDPRKNPNIQFYIILLRNHSCLPQLYQNFSAFLVHPAFFLS
ncbi:hypothetical protein F8M41_019625 [Gigaspora margarita]|uniref:Uncharacterized protein n=1 Tax=Gigaspora margarita TaxID=4874 RepID=A0A8H4AJQ2_GIGMA|nr:hypothetical protein F8M41_019625 [Gigaspora margarita]